MGGAQLFRGFYLILTKGGVWPVADVFVHLSLLDLAGAFCFCLGITMLGRSWCSRGVGVVPR
jgi:hypothetical protein